MIHSDTIIPQKIMYLKDFSVFKYISNPVLTQDESGRCRWKQRVATGAIDLLLITGIRNYIFLHDISQRVYLFAILSQNISYVSNFIECKGIIVFQISVSFREQSLYQLIVQPQQLYVKHLAIQLDSHQLFEKLPTISADNNSFILVGSKNRFKRFDPVSLTTIEAPEFNNEFVGGNVLHCYLDACIGTHRESYVENPFVLTNSRIFQPVDQENCCLLNSFGIGVVQVLQLSPRKYSFRILNSSLDELENNMLDVVPCYSLAGLCFSTKLVQIINDDYINYVHKCKSNVLYQLISLFSQGIDHVMQHQDKKYLFIEFLLELNIPVGKIILNYLLLFHYLNFVSNQCILDLDLKRFVFEGSLQFTYNQRIQDLEFFSSIQNKQTNFATGQLFEGLLITGSDNYIYLHDSEGFIMVKICLHNSVYYLSNYFCVQSRVYFIKRNGLGIGELCELVINCKYIYLDVFQNISIKQFNYLNQWPVLGIQKQILLVLTDSFEILQLDIISRQLTQLNHMFSNNFKCSKIFFFNEKNLVLSDRDDGRQRIILFDQSSQTNIDPVLKMNFQGLNGVGTILLQSSCNDEEIWTFDNQLIKICKFTLQSDYVVSQLGIVQVELFNYLTSNNMNSALALNKLSADERAIIIQRLKQTNSSIGIVLIQCLQSFPMKTLEK